MGFLSIFYPGFKTLPIVPINHITLSESCSILPLTQDSYPVCFGRDSQHKETLMPQKPFFFTKVCLFIALQRGNCHSVIFACSLSTLLSTSLTTENVMKELWFWHSIHAPGKRLLQHVDLMSAEPQPVCMTSKSVRALTIAGRSS